MGLSAQHRPQGPGTEALPPLPHALLVLSRAVTSGTERIVSRGGIAGISSLEASQPPGPALRTPLRMCREKRVHWRKGGGPWGPCFPIVTVPPAASPLESAQCAACSGPRAALEEGPSSRAPTGTMWDSQALRGWHEHRVGRGPCLPAVVRRPLVPARRGNAVLAAGRLGLHGRKGDSGLVATPCLRGQHSGLTVRSAGRCRWFADTPSSRRGSPLLPIGCWVCGSCLPLGFVRRFLCLS